MATEELSTLVKTMVTEGVEAAKSKDGPTVEKCEQTPRPAPHRHAVSTHTRHLGSQTWEPT